MNVGSLVSFILSNIDFLPYRLSLNNITLPFFLHFLTWMRNSRQCLQVVLSFQRCILISKNLKYFTTFHVIKLIWCGSNTSSNFLIFLSNDNFFGLVNFPLVFVFPRYTSAENTRSNYFHYF